MKTIPMKWFALVGVMLFLSVTVAPSINAGINPEGSDDPIGILNNDGNLFGYVNDTDMNPIEGALVQVYFHGTYEEDYSDSNGYYHVTNIPLCNCTKNCTAYKPGYKPKWVLLSIGMNTIYDFVLISGNILYVGINGELSEGLIYKVIYIL